MAAALITAGSSLIGGIMGSKANAEDRKKQMLLHASQQETDARQKGAAALGNSQVSAFQQMMEAYKASLG